MIEALQADFRGLDTSRKQLRRFGVMVGFALLVVVALLAWRGGWTVGAGARGFAVGGGALIIFGLAAPRVLLPLYRLWMGLALVLGHVMTRVLLTLVFFLVVTPIGLVRRVARRDPIEKSAEPGLATYWIKRGDTPDRERLERYW